jgi:hypothetical protein
VEKVGRPFARLTLVVFGLGLASLGLAAVAAETPGEATSAPPSLGARAAAAAAVAEEAGAPLRGATTCSAAVAGAVAESAAVAVADAVRSGGRAEAAAITARAREPFWTVPLHPLIVAMALAIQWWALVLWVLGIKPGWKGRAVSATETA